MFYIESCENECQDVILKCIFLVFYTEERVTVHRKKAGLLLQAHFPGLRYKSKYLFLEETDLTELVSVVRRKCPRSKWFKVYVSTFHMNGERLYFR